MQKFAVPLLLLVVACSSAINHSEKTVRLQGWVSDAACGVEHAKAGSSASCVRKCLKGGASAGHPEWKAQAMVLVLDDTQKIYVVNNPESLLGREAEHVVVEAIVDGEALRVLRVVQ
ncbi:MAG TPA: hypothetical protein VMU84_18365 [Thermoanaerobaculia bacterium]|nr:hypothetical protein [Thermoanaerobaculia bacterium]